MKKKHKTHRRSEDGIALLIAIFVLLLISVVAIALLVSSGTETALGANYRASSTVYYAALAGLEEARGRLLSKNPNYFGLSVIPTVLPVGQVVYVINRLPTESTIQPWSSGDPYYDNEYSSEFGAPPSSWQSVYSVWDNNIQGNPGPLYKWVRINAATEASLYIDVNQSGSYNTTRPLYYDPAHVDSHGNPWPSLISTSSPPSTAVQALEITALAQLPNGSKKILQYLVAPSAVSLNFPAALTLDGNDIGDPGKPGLPFSVPDGAGFFVNGNDQFSTPNGCTPPWHNKVYGIGYTNNDSSYSNILAAIQSSNHGNYLGYGAADPNVNPVGTGAPPGPSLSPNLLTVSGLDSLVTTISQNADVPLTGPVNQSALPATMSLTNPMTIAVQGDLDLSGWSGTGYGILLVTGTFTYDPNVTWNGIVLVIGKGILNAGYEGAGTPGQINGAVLVARTLDQSGNPLPLSSPSMSPSFNYIPADSSLGISYSSCWVQYVQSPLRYQVLSFHEIPQ